MLPPNLSKLKEALIKKGYPKRTRGEDAVLLELEALDGSKEVSESIAKGQLRTFSAVFDGPAGTCPCCGREV